ncbi:MAG TPA: hypothetical protein PLG85_06840 [Cyclobacteriaceae bacterium]|nr:hypothetical protein [Cyclobacteriaceae bacterium]
MINKKIIAREFLLIVSSVAGAAIFLSVLLIRNEMFLQKRNKIKNEIENTKYEIENIQLLSSATKRKIESSQLNDPLGILTPAKTDEKPINEDSIYWANFQRSNNLHNTLHNLEAQLKTNSTKRLTMDEIRQFTLVAFLCMLIIVYPIRLTIWSIKILRLKEKN